MQPLCLLFGVAREDITPSFPVVMDGFAARQGKSTGVRDPLYLQALALKDGPETCLVITLDLIGLDDGLQGRMKALLHTSFGLDESHVMLLCTHTHSGPASGVLYGLEKSPEYWDHVAEKLLRAAKAAFSQMAPCRIDAAAAPLTIGVNRRELRQGKMVIGADFGKQRDDLLRVLRVCSQDKIQVALCNASCHPVTLTAENREISADFPGTAYSLAAGVSEPFVLFSASGSGNINPIRSETETDEEALKRAGDGLRAALGQALAQPCQSPIESGLRCLKAAVQVPIFVERNPERLLEQRNEYAQKWREAENDVDRYVASVYLAWYDERLAHAHDLDPDSLEVTLQLFGIGESIAILALPFEVFVETLEALLTLFESLGGERGKLFVCSCANAVKGYLPPADAIQEGGYEVERAPIWYHLPGSYTRESEPAVLSACRELLTKFLGERG